MSQLVARMAVKVKDPSLWEKLQNIAFEGNTLFPDGISSTLWCLDSDWSAGPELYGLVSNITNSVDVFFPTERFIKNNLKYDKDADTMIIKDPDGLLRDIKTQIKL